MASVSTMSSMMAPPSTQDVLEQSASLVDRALHADRSYADLSDLLLVAKHSKCISKTHQDWATDPYLTCDLKGMVHVPKAAMGNYLPCNLQGRKTPDHVLTYKKPNFHENNRSKLNIFVPLFTTLFFCPQTF